MLSTVELMNVTSKTTKAALEAELRRVTAIANDNHNALESFQTRVYEVALEQKEENDWCDEGFAKAMAELGLETPSRYRRVTIVVDLDMLDQKGPIAADLGDLAEGWEDSDVIDNVVSALNDLDSPYYGYDKDTIHMLKVETLDFTPDKTLTQKERRRSDYNGY